jgi:hypothetical protein
MQRKLEFYRTLSTRFIFIERHIYLDDDTDVVENEEMYNHLLLKTNVCFLIKEFYTILFLNY